MKMSVAQTTAVNVSPATLQKLVHAIHLHANINNKVQQLCRVPQQAWKLFLVTTRFDGSAQVRKRTRTMDELKRCVDMVHAVPFVQNDRRTLFRNDQYHLPVNDM